MLPLTVAVGEVEAVGVPDVEALADSELVIEFVLEMDAL